MNIHLKENATEIRLGLQSRGERGFVATVLFIALLVIVLMLAMAGGTALFHLHNEVRTLEQQQIKRLDSSTTNSVANSHLGISRTGPK
jgi:hypothetical protein